MTREKFGEASDRPRRFRKFVHGERQVATERRLGREQIAHILKILAELGHRRLRFLQCAVRARRERIDLGAHRLGETAIPFKVT